MHSTHRKKDESDLILRYAKVLEKTRWAADFSWENIQCICNYIHPVSAKKGAVVFREGQKDESLGLIVKGSISILKKGDKEIKKVATLKSSQTFGEMALLDGEPRSASGVATEDTVIFFISKNSLLELAEDHPKLGFRLLWKISKLVSQHLRQTTGKLVDFMSS